MANRNGFKGLLKVYYIAYKRYIQDALQDVFRRLIFKVYSRFSWSCFTIAVMGKTGISTTTGESVGNSCYSIYVSLFPVNKHRY